MGIVRVEADRSVVRLPTGRSDSDPASHNMRYLRIPKTTDQPLVCSLRRIRRAAHKWLELSPPAVTRSKAFMRGGVCAQADQPFPDEISRCGNATGCRKECNRARRGSGDECASRSHGAFALNMARFAEHARVAGISRLCASGAIVSVHRKEKIMTIAVPAENCARSMLSCVWFATRNPDRPLACKWMLEAWTVGHSRSDSNHGSAVL